MVPSISAVEYCRMLLADVLASQEKVTVARRSAIPQRRERRKENSLDYSSGKAQGMCCTAGQENHHSRTELEAAEKLE